MKKWVILLVLLFSAVVCRAEDLSAAICEYSKPAVVTITAGNKTGSGFFIDAAGYILTNAHVIRDEKKITVLLSNKKEVPAEIAAVAEKADVALLRISEINVPVLRLGNSAKMRQADQVLILGAPQGLSFTASRASIGATEREEKGVKYIQIDGPVNPGNSGGPVINMRGEVIGITTAMLMNAQSIGFALPIDTVYEFLKKQPVTLDVAFDNDLMALKNTGKPQKKAVDKNVVDDTSSIWYALFWLILSWVSLSVNAIILLRYLSKRNSRKRQLKREKEQQAATAAPKAVEVAEIESAAQGTDRCEVMNDVESKPEQRPPSGA